MSDADRDRSPGDEVHLLVDISTGGIQFTSSDLYEVDEEVICHFELPESLCFVLPARNVHAPDEPSATPSQPTVAVEFAGLDENNRSQLLRWVYREQARHHREQEREKSANRDSGRGAKVIPRAVSVLGKIKSRVGSDQS